MSSKPKILMVDDSPNNLVALHSVFYKMDYELIEANSGEEALAVLMTNKDISIVLLDVQMPGMDGFQTAAQIKKIPHYQDIPIIFITAIFREDPFVKKGYEAGGIDYFGKPFDPDVLRLKVGVYVSHRQKVQLLVEREKTILKTEELLKAGKKFSTSFETLPFGVIIADTEGKVMLKNFEVDRILLTSEALLQVDDILKNHARMGSETHTESFQMKNADGTEKIITCSASPLRTQDGKTFGSGVIIQDITESKKIGKDLEESIMSLLSRELQPENSSHQI